MVISKLKNKSSRGLKIGLNIPYGNSSDSVKIEDGISPSTN